MGATCCTNHEESHDLNTYFTLTSTRNHKELMSNMERLKRGEFSEHVPHSQIATQTDEMNPLNRHVQSVYETQNQKVSLPKTLLMKYEALPFLGPFQYQDESTYEGQY